MTLFFATFPTPEGLFSVAVNPEGAIVATAFGRLARLRGRAPDASQFIEKQPRRSPRTAVTRPKELFWLVGD